MPFFEEGDVRIHYLERGSGFPLFIIHGGGMDSAVSFPRGPFDAMEAFATDYRCVTMDLRNSNSGQSRGPLDLERPWDMYTDDQLRLLDHLGIDKFLMLGFCIGNPLIWNLVKRAPQRVLAAVSAQPSGVDPEKPHLFYQRNMAEWGPALCARDPEFTMQQVERFLRQMYQDVDFVITASRDFVANCPMPLLVLPDDTPSHPYATAMEMARLSPNAQVSLFPWKNSKENTELAIRHIRTFLKAHLPNDGETAGTTLSANDRLEIYELIARYNHAEDSGDIDTWVGTFTKDGSFRGLRANSLVVGHDELRRFALERQLRPGVREYVHWTSNISITAAEAGARARSYVMMMEQTPEGGFRIRGMSIKTDALCREDGRWRFKSRINKPWPSIEADCESQKPIA